MVLLLKPKDVGMQLNTPPEKISVFAHEIENARLHTFPKTALGSFLFEEKDVEILKEYHDLTFFFRKKKEALHMLHQSLLYAENETQGYPEWTRFLYNAKLYPK